MRPLISILMPSCNQARYLEAAIDSVLSQNYPHKELIIIDGGSVDGSRKILKRYERFLAFWQSVPDRGQADALNQALAKARGTVIGWQNSDDIYYPNAFDEAIDALAKTNANMVFGNVRLIDSLGAQLGELRFTPFSLRKLIYEGHALANQAAFWTRRLQDVVGAFDPTLQFCMDYDFFLRVGAVGHLHFVRRTWGAFRIHERAKSSMERFLRIGAEEHRVVLHKWFPTVAHASPAKACVQRTISKIERSIGYLYQGDVLYVLRGIHRRVRRLQNGYALD